MSNGATEADEDPLDEILTYNGKIYWVNIPPAYTLNFDALCEKLRGEVFYAETDIDTEESVVVPEPFQYEDGIAEIITVTDIRHEWTNIPDIQGGNVLLGDVVIDRPDTTEYRDETVLFRTTDDAKFISFQYDDIQYFVFIAKRALTEKIVETLRDSGDALGTALNETHLPHQYIREIRSELSGDLENADIRYTDSSLDSLVFHGSGFQDHEIYDQQRKRGELRTHMFYTDELADEEKLLGIYSDGLVRSVTNIHLPNYIDLLTDYILPRIGRVEESSPSLSAYDSESVFAQTGSD